MYQQQSQSQQPVSPGPQSHILSPQLPCWQGQRSSHQSEQVRFLRFRFRFLAGLEEAVESIVASAVTIPRWRFRVAEMTSLMVPEK
jgi:hypothetical protein